jgi:cytochrome c-type biogenesis protein CcmH
VGDPSVRPTAVAVHRRGFVLGLTAVVFGRGAWSQEPEAQSPQEPADAGRLYNPGVVQQRARSTDADNDEYIKDLEKQMRCTCGCNLDIYTCRTTDFTCTTSPALHREVVALHESGLSGQEILDDFVARYGEDVLMAPKPEGFNLAGYLVPGILVSLVGMILIWVLYRRQSVIALATAEKDALPEAVPGIAATPEELARLEAAIREGDR